MSRTGKIALLAIFGAFAILVYMGGFNLRYIWYLESTQALILLSGAAGCALAIVACWTFFPSRLAVIFFALAGLLFPMLLDERFRAFNLSVVPYLVAVIILLTAVTELRRRIFRAAP